MKTKKNLITIAIASAICLTLTIVYHANASKTYEIRPDIAVDIAPAYQGDPYMIDAYQRLMDRYMTMVDSNLKDNTTSLKSIEKKTDDIIKRLKRIEKHLGIDPSENKPVKAEKQTPTP